MTAFHEHLQNASNYASAGLGRLCSLIFSTTLTNSHIIIFLPLEADTWEKSTTVEIPLDLLWENMELFPLTIHWP